MRPNAIVAERQGDLGGEKVAMSFHADSVAHIMSVLTDLYSDPELAVIREYSTNALDSQIAAGVNRPIEVTTPNSFSPFFKVKDFGLGMDDNDIKNIYSQYGASTKRESDTQVGMLGLGCKSALTYTQQFTINSVKDGMRYSVAVSRTEDGSGVMEIVDSAPCDDVNGVEIVVPVKRMNDFHSKSVRFFKYWEKGTVLLNGEVPAGIDGRKLDDKTFLIPGRGSSHVVMGNVAYPVNESHSISASKDVRYAASSFSVVAYVDIGDVNFTPSRESLHYTRKTEQTLSEIKQRVSDGINDVIQKDIDDAEDHVKALEVLYEWVNIVTGGYIGNMAKKDFSYNGETIPLEVRSNFLCFNLHRQRYAVEERWNVSTKILSSRPVIHEYPKDKINSHDREKIRLWLRQNNISASELFVFETLPDVEKWINKDMVASWEDVKTVKVPREPAAPRPPATFDIIVDGTYHRVSKEDIPKNKTLALIPPKERTKFNKNFIPSFKKVFPDVVIVILAENRWDKFKREHSNVIIVKDSCKEAYTEASKNLTEEDKRSMYMEYNVRHMLRELDPARIDDPELTKFIRAANVQSDTDTLIAYENAKNLGRHFGYFEAVPKLQEENPLSKYPLLKGIDYFYTKSESIKHCYIYVNAVYSKK